MDDPSFDSPPDVPDPGTLPAHVPLRARHDGWTPQRQHDFIAALAETGCVTDAAAAVKMSVRSAYRLRVQVNANIFRQAWDIALDFAIRNLSEAAISRAIKGVARPVFYKGEQVGERVHFDERLTQFLLRYRDPVRYGAWRDHYEARQHPDGAGMVLAHALNTVTDAAHGYTIPDDADDPDTDPGRPLAEGPARVGAFAPYDPSRAGKEEFLATLPDDDAVAMRGIYDHLAAMTAPLPDPLDDDWRSPSMVVRYAGKGDSGTDVA